MGRKVNHKSIVLAAVDDTIEVFFNQNAANTGSNPHIWYFNLDKSAKVIFVKSDKILQITEINNEPLDSPMLIEEDGFFSDRSGAYQDMKYVQIKVKATTTTTHVEIFGRV